MRNHMRILQVASLSNDDMCTFACVHVCARKCLYAYGDDSFAGSNIFFCQAASCGHFKQAVSCCMSLARSVRASPGPRQGRTLS